MNLTTGGVKNRKISALARLEKQLVKGTKTQPKPDTGLELPLTEKDIFRIIGEIKALKEKIKNLN